MFKHCISYDLFGVMIMSTGSRTTNESAEMAFLIIVNKVDRTMS